MIVCSRLLSAGVIVMVVPIYLGMGERKIILESL